MNRVLKKDGGDVAQTNLQAFKFQHSQSISKIPALREEDFATYRVFEVLGRGDLGGLHVLDVGCGTGRVTSHLLARKPDYLLAIDAVADEAQFRSNIENSTRSFEGVLAFEGVLEFKNYDVLKFDATEQFDVVSILGVLHHIPEDSVALSQLHKALKRDGVLVCWVYSDNIGAITLCCIKSISRLFGLLGPVRTPFAKGLALLTKGIASVLPKTHPMADLAKKPISEISLVIYDQLNPTYSRYYSENEIHDLAEKTGFSVERIEATGRKGWTFLLRKKS